MTTIAATKAAADAETPAADVGGGGDDGATRPPVAVADVSAQPVHDATSLAVDVVDSVPADDFESNDFAASAVDVASVPASENL